MKTIIFGGSFDPIHNGHLMIASKAKEEFQADRVVFVLAKQARWKKTKTSDKDRLNMLLEAIKDYKDFEVSTVELNSKSEVNYTFDTIKSYKKQKGEELYFLIGYDQLEKLHLWYRIDELSKMVKFISFSRPNYEVSNENIEKYHVSIFNVNLSNASSTSVRNLTNVDCPLSVLNYIEEKRLYYFEKIETYIKEKRLLHSISVAHVAYEIALRNGISPIKAYTAGLLHDIAKELTHEEQIEFMKENYPSLYNSIPRALYHQFIGADIVEKEFHIIDNEILDAIKVHATGSSNMSVLAKILYAADKIEPTRGYDSSELINKCYENIDEGFKEVLKENILYFKENNIDYDNPLTNSCIKSYLGKEEK